MFYGFFCGLGFVYFGLLFVGVCLLICVGFDFWVWFSLIVFLMVSGLYSELRFVSFLVVFLTLTGVSVSVWFCG